MNRDIDDRRAELVKLFGGERPMVALVEYGRGDLLGRVESKYSARNGFRSRPPRPVL